jgi:addiction module RelB/DinJ family antitoxin
MMTNITIRIDETIKQEAEKLFDKLGLSMSGAINVFFRQAIREQAIPFSIRAKTPEEKYNEYFTPEVVASIKNSIAQAERGELISFSMAELQAMENGDIPERAADFMEKHNKGECGQ